MRMWANRAAGAALLTASFVAIGTSGAACAVAATHPVAAFQPFQPVGSDPGGRVVIPGIGDLGDALSGQAPALGPRPAVARQVALPGPPVSEPIGRPIPLGAPISAPGSTALTGGSAVLPGGFTVPAAEVMSLAAVLGAGGLPARRPDTPSVSPVVPDRDVSRPGMPPVSAAPKVPRAKASRDRSPAAGGERGESATALPGAGAMKGPHRDPARIAPSLPSAQETTDTGSWSSSTPFGLVISALLGVGAMIMVITRRIRLRRR
jgi:hypothetical protein